MNEFCRTISKRLLLTFMAFLCSLVVVAQNVTVTPRFSGSYVSNEGVYYSVVGNEIAFNVSVDAGYTVTAADFAIYSDTLVVSGTATNSLNIPAFVPSVAGDYSLKGNVDLRRVVADTIIETRTVEIETLFSIIDPSITLQKSEYKVISEENFEIEFVAGTALGSWEIDWTVSPGDAQIYNNGGLTFFSAYLNSTSSPLQVKYQAECKYYLYGVLLHREVRDINVTVYAEAKFDYTTNNLFNISERTALDMGFALSGANPDGWTYSWSMNGTPILSQSGNTDTQNFVIDDTRFESYQLNDWISTSAGNRENIGYGRYDINILSGGELSFDWEVNGGHLIVTVDGVEILNVSGNESGHYSKSFDTTGTYALVVMQNDGGTATLSNIFVDNQTVDFEDWTSTNGGQNNSTSSNIYTFDAFANAELTFDWQVSSESNYDWLIITLNGEEVIKQSGQKNGHFSRTLSSTGSYTLEVKYTKDGSQHKNSDYGKISNISIGDIDESIGNWYSNNAANQRPALFDTYQFEVVAGAELMFDFEVNDGTLLVTIDGTDILNVSEDFVNHCCHIFNAAGTHILELKYTGNGYARVSNIFVKKPRSRLPDWDSANANRIIRYNRAYNFNVPVADTKLDFDWEVSAGTLIVTSNGSDILNKSGDNSGRYTGLLDSAGNYILESNYSGEGRGLISNVVVDSPTSYFEDWTSTNGAQNSSTSSERYTFNVCANTELSFDWEVSSESNYDWLIITLNGEQLVKQSGQKNGHFSRTISSTGSYTLEVKYTKDGSQHSYADCGIVSNITVDYSEQNISPTTSYQTESLFDIYTLEVAAGAELLFNWSVNGGTFDVLIDGNSVLNVVDQYTNGNFNHTFDADGVYSLEFRYTGSGNATVSDIMVDKYYDTYIYSVTAENTCEDRVIASFVKNYIVNLYPRTDIAISNDSIYNFAEMRDLTLMVETTGGRIGGWQYEWFRNDELAATGAENCAIFSETPGERFAMNIYKVIAKNIAENGDVMAVKEKSFSANVYPAPVLEFISDSIFNFLGCDSIIKLEYAKRGGYSDGWAYEWRKNGEVIANYPLEEYDSITFGLKSDCIYYIHQPHHRLGKTSWAVAENGNMLQSNVELGIECDPYDVRQQFKFITHGDAMYLYHVGEGKYVNKDRMLSNVPSDTIGFTSGAYDNTIFFNFGNNYNVNVNGNQCLVIDYFTTPDGGNSCELLDVEGLNYYNVDSLNVALAETEGAVEDVYELIATNTFKDGTEWFCDTITFNVNTYPQTSIGYMTDSEFNFADERSIHLGVEATGGYSNGWRYQWTLNGSVVEGDTPEYYAYLYPGGTLVQNEYKVVATNSAANGDVLKVYEMDFAVNVYPRPVFRQTKEFNQQAVGAVAFERSVVVDGGYPTGWEIIWRRNDVIVATGDVTREFVEDNTTNSEVKEVIYSVQAINRFADGTEWHNHTIEFPVRIYPEITCEYISIPDGHYDLYNETLDLGTNFYGGVTGTDNGSWTFEWRKNGSRLYDANDHVYTHNVVNNSANIQNIEYTLVAKHWIGGDEVWSNISKYYVDSYPLARINHVTGSDTTICGGNDVRFAMDVRCADEIGWRYEWRRDGKLLSGETAPSIVVREENDQNRTSVYHTYELTAVNIHDGEEWERRNYTFNSTIRPKLHLPEMMTYEKMLREGDFIELGATSGSGGYPDGWRYTWYNSHDGSRKISSQTGAALDEYTDVETYGHLHKEMRTENYMLHIRNVDVNSNTPVHYEDTLYFQLTIHRCPQKPYKLRRKGDGSSKIFIADMIETTGLNNAQLESNDYSFAFGYGNSEIVRDDYTLRYQMYTQIQAANNPWVYTYWEYEDGYVCKSDKVYLNSRATSDDVEEDVITVDYNGFKASLKEAVPANVRVYSFDGAVVKQMSYDEQTEFDEKFDLIDLDEGFYLIEVCIGDNREVKKIFIKE